MICRNCATGADVLSRANQIKLTNDHMVKIQDQYITTSLVLQAAGNVLHTQCVGETHCPCQHKPPNNG